jgi:hypothetical protein
MVLGDAENVNPAVAPVRLTEPFRAMSLTFSVTEDDKWHPEGTVDGWVVCTVHEEAGHHLVFKTQLRSGGALFRKHLLPIFAEKIRGVGDSTVPEQRSFLASAMAVDFEASTAPEEIACWRTGVKDYQDRGE